MYVPTAASPAEMPLLMTAYEDSYHSYAASLADVDAQLTDLAAREAAIKGSMESARRSFAALEADMREQEAAVQHHQERSEARRLEVQERLAALQRRRERLATYAKQRHSLVAEDEAVAAQEAYWEDLCKSHQRALDTLTSTRRLRWRDTPSPSRGGVAPVGGSPANIVSTHHIPHPPPTQFSGGPSPSLTNCWPDAVRAAQAGHAASLASLLRACPEAAQATDADGNTLLQLACAAEPPSLATVRCLVRCHAPLHLHDAAGLTAFHLACLNRQDPTHAVVEALLAAGVPVDEATASGETAAHLLASHDAFLDTLAFLVDHHGLDVTRQAMVAGQPRTPLDVAEYYGGAQTCGVRELLRALV